MKNFIIRTIISTLFAISGGLLTGLNFSLWAWVTSIILSVIALEIMDKFYILKSKDKNPYTKRSDYWKDVKGARAIKKVGGL